MLLALGAVVVLGAVVLLGEVQLARSGEQLPAPDVATLTTTVGSGARAVRVVWLGDSTAAAVGASDAAHSVSSQVAGQVSARAPSIRLDVRVLAHSGDRIADVVHDQLPRVQALAADVVVISIGANDVIHLTKASTFRRQYNELLDGLRDAGLSTAKVVLVGVPDMGSPTRLKQPLRWITGWRGRRLDREVKAVAARFDTAYVDLFAATSKPFRANPAKYLASDNYHPSDSGYELWADAIAPVLARVI